LIIPVCFNLTIFPVCKAYSPEIYRQVKDQHPTFAKMYNATMIYGRYLEV